MAVTAQTETPTVGSVAADSLASDTIAPVKEVSYGVVFSAPDSSGAEPVRPTGSGMSWILSGMLLVFAVVCLRYRRNSRYFSLMLNDVLEVRVRHNAFDDTLRETSFIWLLNFLWCCSMGFLLYCMLFSPGAGRVLGGADVGRIFICMGMCVAYTVFLTMAYSAVGYVFADGESASVWVKGSLACQGLECVAMFPLALLAMCVPSLAGAMTVLGIIVFILGKLLFIYKGFCIFFTEMTSWVLFLYYLCSLEIVPIVLTYAGAWYLCGLV